MLVGGAIGLLGARLATGAGVGALRRTLPWTCAFLAAAPDLDVVMHAVVDYAHPFGHRGAFHSLGCYALVALIVATLPKFRVWRVGAGLCVFAALASHSLLDMMTNGGLGIALWWPFSNERSFLPWRPIPVSPLSAGAFFSGRGLRILSAELPFALPIFAAAWLLRRPSRRDDVIGDNSAPESEHEDEERDAQAAADSSPHASAAPDEEDLAVLEITDSIDLHAFAPRDILSVVEAYLEAAWEKGFDEVRLIHGRGKGYQRARVQKLLSTHPLVLRYRDAPATRGGWGATIAWLKEKN